MLKRLAIIPARKGSQRIENKNIYNFHGKPIIWYPLNSAKKSKLFDTIHVSSNCDKILNLTKKLGFPIHFKRPDMLANSHVGLLEVLNYVLNEFEKKNKFFDVVSLIYPCSPLIDYKDLKKANKLFEKNKKKNPVISIASYPAPPEWSLEKRGKFICSVNPDKVGIRSQDLKRKYFDTADFVFYSSNHVKKFVKLKKIDFSKFIGYEIDKHRAIDIDELEDINFAKKLYLLQN